MPCAGARFQSTNTVHPVVLKTPNGAMAGSESYCRQPHLSGTFSLSFNTLIVDINSCPVLDLFLSSCASHFHMIGVENIMKFPHQMCTIIFIFFSGDSRQRQRTTRSAAKTKSRTAGGWRPATLPAAHSPTSWSEGAFSPPSTVPCPAHRAPWCLPARDARALAHLPSQRLRPLALSYPSRCEPTLMTGKHAGPSRSQTAMK
jgi:hypothetical protein